MKIEHKKIFRGSSKILKNISWPINICLKYFMTPQKLFAPTPPKKTDMSITKIEKYKKLNMMEHKRDMNITEKLSSTFTKEH